MYEINCKIYIKTIIIIFTYFLINIDLYNSRYLSSFKGIEEILIIVSIYIL